MLFRYFPGFFADFSAQGGGFDYFGFAGLIKHPLQDFVFGNGGNQQPEGFFIHRFDLLVAMQRAAGDETFNIKVTQQFDAGDFFIFQKMVIQDAVDNLVIRFKAPSAVFCADDPVESESRARFSRAALMQRAIFSNTARMAASW